MKLFSLSGDNATEILSLEEGRVTIGRDSSNVIMVDSDAVSRNHSAIEKLGDFWFYFDLGSTNGSWIDGVEVEVGIPTLLRDGDVVQVANFPVKFVDEIEKLGINIICMEGDTLIETAELDEPIKFNNEGMPTLRGAVIVLRSTGQEVDVDAVTPGAWLNNEPLVVGQKISVYDRDVITVGFRKLILSHPISRVQKQSGVRRSSPNYSRVSSATSGRFKEVPKAETPVRIEVAESGDNAKKQVFGEIELSQSGTNISSAKRFTTETKTFPRTDGTPKKVEGGPMRFKDALIEADEMDEKKKKIFSTIGISTILMFILVVYKFIAIVLKLS